MGIYKTNFSEKTLKASIGAFKESYQNWETNEGLKGEGA
jgi:hypothetical protein